MNAITVSNQGFSLTPRNFMEAMKFSEMIARTDLAPKDFRGKPENILVAIQMGHEIGLLPMQALQNIAVIGGRPCVWGDAALALVQASCEFESIEETVDEYKAICIIKRKGQKAHTEAFTKEDAVKARLWNKPGPWTDYPKRMMQMRARGFALRNKFADVLKGFNIGEEVRDYVDITPSPDKIKVSAAEETLSPVEYAAPDAIDRLNALFKAHNVDQNKIDKWLGDSAVTRLEELTQSKVLAAIAKLERQVLADPDAEIEENRQEKSSEKITKADKIASALEERAERINEVGTIPQGPGLNVQAGTQDGANDHHEGAAQ